MEIDLATSDERKIHIKELIQSSNKTETLIFDKKSYECKVIEVDPRYLLYRLSNTRTKLKQRTYILKQDKASDFFHPDREENQEVQEAQHEILLSQNLTALKGSYDRKGGQDEALVIYPDGKIINGNTRTAFMRHEGMSPIKCTVVDDPFLRDKEIEMESELDIGPSGKIDYDDFAIGASIVDLKEMGKSNEDIARIKSLKPQEVKILAQAYELAQERLKLEGKEDDWDILSKSDQLYQDAAKDILNPNKTAEEKEALKSTVMLLDAASTAVIPGNKHKHYEKVSKHSEKAKIFFEDIFGSVEMSQELFGDDDVSIKTFDKDNFKEAFDSQDGIDERASQILTKVEDHIDDLADAGQKTALKKHVNTASRALLASKNLLNRDDLEIDGLIEKLADIETNLIEVRDYVSNKSDS